MEYLKFVAELKKMIHKSVSSFFLYATDGT